MRGYISIDWRGLDTRVCTCRATFSSCKFCFYVFIETSTKATPVVAAIIQGVSRDFQVELVSYSRELCIAYSPEEGIKEISGTTHLV